MSSGNAFYCINVRCDVLLDDILALAEPAALCLVCDARSGGLARDASSSSVRILRGV